MCKVSEYEYAKMLYIKGHLPGPTILDGVKNFDIQKFTQQNP